MAAVLVLAGLALAATVFVFVMLGLLLQVAIRIILFPLFLLKWIVTGLVMLVVGPVLALVGLLLAIVFAALVAVPLLPLLVLGTFVWLIVRANRRPAVA